MTRWFLLGVALLVLLGSQAAWGAQPAGVTLPCSGTLIVPAGDVLGDGLAAGCAGQVNIVATINGPGYHGLWVESVRYFPRPDRVTVHLNAKAPVPLKVAWVGFRS